MRSIHGENAEAMRYASQLVTDGLEIAEKNRRLTRISNEGESTPLREKNYLTISSLITNLSIDLVKADLRKASSLMATHTEIFLDAFIENTTSSTTEDAYERLEEERRRPRTFFETLYYQGITKGVTPNNVNILKLAQQLMEKRISIAYDCGKIVGNMAAYSRSYYKMIKVDWPYLIPYHLTRFPYFFLSLLFRIKVVSTNLTNQDLISRS